MKEKDIVIATQPVNGIDINSVGIIKSIFHDRAYVHFVGKNEEIIAPLNSLHVIDVDSIGDGYPSKICNICHILKPVEEFSRNQNTGKGRPTTRPSCKICRKDIDGKKMPASERRRMNEVKPSDKTAFVCPICDKRTIVNVTVRIVPDHSHKTGKGRDWICDSCNTGLGRFKDDIAFVEKIIEYLKCFEDEESENSDSVGQAQLNLE